MKKISGVMVMKEGKAWGITYSDGHETSYGWVEPENAIIDDVRFLKKPEYATRKGSPDVEELRTGKLVYVERITTVHILGDVDC